MNNVVNRPKAIGYLRVSTKNQGLHGIGLLAQKEAISAYAREVGVEVVIFEQDVRSGAGADALANRPGLRRAIARAQEEDMVILAYDWDRIARDENAVQKILSEYGVKIIAVARDDCRSEASIRAATTRARLEREEISQRTREALAKAKRAGARLGNTKNLHEAQRLGQEANRQAAEKKAREIAKFLIQHPEISTWPLWRKAEALNKAHILTRTGRLWTVDSLRPAMKRVRELTCTANVEAYPDRVDWGLF